MTALPLDAVRAVSRIETMLDEAKRVIDRSGVADECAFVLRETERRYLPDTLGAYFDIPPSRRDAVADARLLEQLALLERATASRLAELSQAGDAALSANGAFLAERFADEADALAPVPPDAVALPAPRALVARYFADLPTARGTDVATLLPEAGRRLSAVFPALTTIRRGMFGGPVKSVSIDVPRGADVLRYTLEAERGGIAATATKIVRGVALRTERVDPGEWMRGLLDDMAAYVERDRAARELLTGLLGG